MFNASGKIFEFSLPASTIIYINSMKTVVPSCS
ncbi:MAG: hypothetical protein JWQ14_543 [Adhaeribacter sp.]|nr:hypothetical protein [Adhaeribacter sp.]